MEEEIKVKKYKVNMVELSTQVEFEYFIDSDEYFIVSDGNIAIKDELEQNLSLVQY